MLMKVYRLYSEGSGELFESFIWDLLSLFKKQLSATSWEVACRHTMLLCVQVFMRSSDCMLGDDENTPCVVLVHCGKKWRNPFNLTLFISPFVYSTHNSAWMYQVLCPGDLGISYIFSPKGAYHQTLVWCEFLFDGHPTHSGD